MTLFRFNISVVQEAKIFYTSLPEVDFSLANVERSDVVYKYFSDSTQEAGKILTVDNAGIEIVKKTIPMVILIHGWTTDDTSPWFESLKGELFKLGPHNVIYINWSKAGNKPYEISCANIKPAGNFIAEFLIRTGVPQEKIHIIGHSLGSQLSSFVGKSMLRLSGKRLGRITALDPAGPKFVNPLMGYESRLCDTDADFVDVVHTDIQLFGVTAPIGHVDWYPNEGKHQPGCPPREESENCSHARSTVLYLESVSKKSKGQAATFKELDNEVTITVNNNASEVIFGHHIDISARGVYFCETNSQPPYLK